MEFRAAHALRGRYPIRCPYPHQLHNRQAHRSDIPRYSMGNNGQIGEWLAGRSDWSTRDSGALVIGGDYRSLGTVRSLGRHNIPVWVLTDEHLIAGVSRYARRRLPWPQADERRQVEYLMALNA